jgi:hypothetical protein
MELISKRFTTELAQTLPNVAMEFEISWQEVYEFLRYEYLHNHILLIPLSIVCAKTGWLWGFS